MLRPITIRTEITLADMCYEVDARAEVFISAVVDGRIVAGYWRRPRAKWIGEVRPMFIGTVTDAGTQAAPLLVG